MSKLDYVYTRFETYSESGSQKKSEIKLQKEMGFPKGIMMGFMLEDMRLTEAHFFSCETRVGEICTAMVDKILPSLDGAFLIGPGEKPMFLRLSESEGKEIILRRRGTRKDKPLSAGDTVLVQISADAQKNKQVEATVNLSLVGELVIVNRTGVIGGSGKLPQEMRNELKNEMRKLMEEQDPEGEFGLILRTAAAGAEVKMIREEVIELLCELKRLIHSAETIPEKKVVYSPEETPEKKVKQIILSGAFDQVTVHTDLPFNKDEILGAKDLYKQDEKKAVTEVLVHHIEEGDLSPLITFNIRSQLDKSMARKVYLSDGGFLIVDPTEAMTVIDVNSGKSIRGKDHEEKALAVNLLAAEEIARLIRLRNLSGIIIVDFISMKDKEKEKNLLQKLREFVRNDPAGVTVVDVTSLGLVEITRKKRRAPLKEVFMTSGQNIPADR